MLAGRPGSGHTCTRHPAPRLPLHDLGQPGSSRCGDEGQPHLSSLRLHRRMRYRSTRRRAPSAALVRNARARPREVRHRAERLQVR